MLHGMKNCKLTTYQSILSLVIVSKNKYQQVLNKCLTKYLILYKFHVLMFTLHFYSSFYLSLILLSTSVRYHNRNLLWVTEIYWQSDPSYLLTSFPLITNLISYFSTSSALQTSLGFSECSAAYWTLIFSSHHVSILLSLHKKYSEPFQNILFTDYIHPGAFYYSLMYA